MNKKNLIIFISAFILLISCINSNNTNKNNVFQDAIVMSEEKLDLRINALFPTDFLKKENSARILSSSAQLLICYKIKYQNIQYNVGIDANSKIKYIETRDKEFRTPEGISIGMTYKEVLDICNNNDLQKMLGWGFFIPLQSGWNVAFSVGKTMTDFDPTSKSLVMWIFKR